MTEVLIWITGSTLLFAAALTAGHYLFKRSAAKRRHLFSAALGFSIAIPIFAIGIHSLSQLEIPIVNNALRQVSSLIKSPNTVDQKSVSVTLDSSLPVTQNPFANDSSARFTPVPTISSVNEVLLQPIIPQTITPEPTQPLLSDWKPIILRVLLVIWLLGGCLSVTRLFWSLWKSHRCLRDGYLLSNGTVHEILQSVGFEVGLKKLPQVYAISENISPAVVSPFQPKVVFSETALERLNHEELRVILTHELSHIKRRDLPLNFIMQIVLAIHWFNPLAHRVFRQFRLCQEELCDNEVTQSNDQFSYARLLIKVNQMFSGTENRCALAAISSNKIVGRRVDRLLDEYRDPGLTPGWLWQTGSTTIALLTCLTISLAVAATQTQPLTAAENSKVESSNHSTTADDEDLDKLTYELLTQWHVDGNISKLSWKHIPYLMKHIEDDKQIERIPAHPFSSQSQDNCTVGTTAMWFIDMICCDQLPALNPIFLANGLDDAESSADAIQSFRTWWELVEDWPASEARRVNPLMFSNLTWQGGRNEIPYAQSPVLALTNFFNHKKVISVSPNGKLVFITANPKEKPITGTLSKITKDGLVEQWKMNDFEAKSVFILDSGLLVKTTDFHDVGNDQSQPHLEFIKEGKLIESVDLAKISEPELKLVPFKLDLQIDKDRLRINAQFEANDTTHQNAFLFDQLTGNLLETLIFQPGSDKAKKITAELHSDEQIQELATFDIDKISPTESILKTPILDVVPAGQTRTRGEVFEVLNLNENLATRFRHEQQGRVIFLTWQVSPSYDLSVMTGTRDPKNAKLELTDRKLRVYGVRLLPSKPDK